MLFSSDCSALRDILDASNATYGCNLEADTWYNGGGPVLSPDLSKFNDILSYYECALLCAGSSTCQFWAFDHGDCELSSTEPSEKQRKSNATSGPRICGQLASSLNQGSLKGSMFVRKSKVLTCLPRLRSVAPYKKQCIKSHNNLHNVQSLLCI